MSSVQGPVVQSYPAIVTKIEETDKLGQIFVKCSALSGDADTEYPDPIDPCHDWGWFYIPDVGEEVEIEIIVADGFDEDVPGAASIDEQRPRWRGKRFASAEGEQPRPINPLFTDPNYGKRRGFATPKGHVLLFDDTDGQEKIQVYWTNADGDVSCITFLETGGIEVLDKAGNLVALDGAGQIDVTAPKVNINSGGDADQFLVRGDELKTWIEGTLKVAFDTHVHPTAFGPSGPPPAPLTAPPSTILSTDGKLK